MLRVSIVSKLGNTFSMNAIMREDIDTFLLDIDSREGLKMYRIIIKETGEVLEKYEMPKENLI
jgi:hypothetical protein